jgi:hypothetical protein
MRLVRFLWKGRWWLLSVPALILFGVVVHVGAWLLELRLEGAACGDFHVWPHRIVGDWVSFGQVDCVASHEMAFALAPSLAWLAVALTAVYFHARFGRSRFEKPLFVGGLVLPVQAMLLELSTCFVGVSYDGVVLRPLRWIALGVIVPVCAALVAAGWVRFRALFPRALAVHHYVVMWLLLSVLCVYLRHSPAVWTLFARMAP